ncbi:OTU domain-containing protein [Paenibacillus piri]|uniref:Uncharacterized protein n=1 Tax=Paenibacillus piri TaxID=2547395 RepID=A0A4R5KX41_9BACL|nr:OTU domain-containing protein [Paenibacillus piri]TDF99560.1 hypothetical protein E1757_06885 [Paenibacillus piri]
MSRSAPEPSHKSVPKQTWPGGAARSNAGAGQSDITAAAAGAGGGFSPHMGIQLQRTIGNRAAAKLLQSRPVSVSLHAGGNSPIRRMPIVKDNVHRRANEKDSPESIIETSKLSLSERNALVIDLQSEGNEALLDAILKEWGAAPIKDEDKLEHLFELSAQIAKLRDKTPDSYSEEDSAGLKKIELELAEAQSVMDQNGNNPSVQIYRDVIFSLTRELAKLGGKGAEQHAPAELNMQVSPGDRQGYRDDMKRMGTWAGEAEAEKMAEIMHINAPIFVISKGTFRLVTQVGAAYKGVGSLALVHLGNHYEVVRGVQDGTKKGGESEWLKTSKSGDCLFESMLLIHHNGVRKSEEKLQKGIQGMRKLVADGLSDDAIDESIQELLVFGDSAGAGPNTSKLVSGRRAEADQKKQEARRQKIREQNEANVRKVDESFINERESELAELETLDTFGIGKAKKSYLKMRENDPTSQATFKALRELGQLLREAKLALRRQRGDFDLDFSQYEADESSEKPAKRSDETFDRPKNLAERLELEAKARQDTLARDDIKYAGSKNNGKQYVITVNGVNDEFVLDKLGQLVRRFTRRNVSSHNRDEIKGDKHDEERGMYPSNLSPFPRARDKQQARGTGSNKIKNESPEMHHVQGHKPSDYLSVTADTGNAKNPQGKEFDALATYLIDLSYIDPENISAIYTSLGMRYFMLDVFEGDRKDAVGKAEQEQKKSGPSSQKMAKDHKELSEKEWQALLDVIRTKEVLVEGMIPEDALTKL